MGLMSGKKKEVSLVTLLLRAAATKAFEEMKRDPKHAYDRRRASMLLTMIRSVAYKEVGFNQPLLPKEYLVEKGFTILEIDDLMPSCLVLMQVIYEEHPEVFEAIAAARMTKEERRQLDG
jgi:hypothetical protein